MHWLLVVLFAIVAGVLLGTALAAGFLLLVDGEKSVASPIENSREPRGRAGPSGSDGVPR